MGLGEAPLGLGTPGFDVPAVVFEAARWFPYRPDGSLPPHASARWRSPIIRLAKPSRSAIRCLFFASPR